jgi:hypothetical protein
MPFRPDRVIEMLQRVIHAKRAILFIASAVCVSAAAEELQFDKTQWTVEGIASRGLESSADHLVVELANSATHQFEISSDGRVPYTASLTSTDDCPLRATVKAEAPTLFLRYFGVETRPIQIMIDMSPAAPPAGSRSA